MRIGRNWNRLFERLVNGPLPVRSSMGAIVASNGESIHRHAPVPVPARIERRELVTASNDSNSSFRDHVPFTTDELKERELFPHDGDTLQPAHTSRRAPRAPGVHEDDAEKMNGRRATFRNAGRKPREKNHRRA